MKNKASIKTLLGLSQNEMAMLLGITRSQWSMYELGQRDLPTEAMVLLAEMLKYVEEAKQSDRVLPEIQQQKAGKKEHLERLLRENEYQQLIMAKKITAMQKKFNNALAALRVVEFLKNNQQQAAGLQKIQSKASTTVQQVGLAKQESLLLQQELLKLENLLLTAKVRKESLKP